MSHWSKMVVAICDADTDNLRDLAKIARQDPETFYQYTDISGLDIRGQDIRGMAFRDFDLSQMIYDHSTTFTVPDVDPETQKAAEDDATALLINNIPVPSATGLNVRNLDLSNSDFEDTHLLKNCPYLQTLFLGGTKVSDITPLASLTQLRVLSFDGTQVSDITPTRHLFSLTRVWAFNLDVDDWSPLDHVDDVRGRPDDWVRKPSSSA